MQVNSLVAFTLDSGERYLGVVRRYRPWDSQVKVLWFCEPSAPSWTRATILELICEGQ
jgi:hypothetical protein